jgi:probable rRNA maturation factor
VPSALILNRQRGYPSHRLGLSEFLTRVAAGLRPGGDFTVVLVSDRVMRRYNHKYRGQDGTTDVLSFEGEGGYLGDILISAETAFRQSARSKTLTFEANMKRLALHGLLHLMGHDHETDDGEMRAIETRLRRRFKC